MKILVVDDQEVCVKIISSQLHQAGFEVISCSSGEEAVEKLQSRPVDMVITDMEMDGMTGEHIVRHVRRELGSLPVILMSGNPSNLEKTGFDGYIKKPFSMSELLTVIENLGNSRHSPKGQTDMSGPAPACSASFQVPRRRALEVDKPEYVMEEHLEYLDRLRETGVTNMFGATPFIQVQFPELSQREAKQVLVYWMKTFADRHPK